LLNWAQILYPKRGSPFQ